MTFPKVEKIIKDERIKIVDFSGFILCCGREFIMSHRLLAERDTRGDDHVSNVNFFLEDLSRGIMDRYKGTYVAYHKGVFCGQSKEGEKLFD